MSSHWPWLFISGGMPLPFGPVPVPGNALAGGIPSMEYQWMAVNGRIVLRRRGRVRRDGGPQIKLAAGFGLHLRRVDKAKAAHPDAIVGLWKVRNDVAPLVIGDHDLGHSDRQICRFRNDPHAGFWPVRARDDPTQVVGTKRKDARRALLSLQLRGTGRESGTENRDRDATKGADPEHLAATPSAAQSWHSAKGRGRDSLA